jgi:hypothetical protein
MSRSWLLCACVVECICPAGLREVASRWLHDRALLWRGREAPTWLIVCLRVALQVTLCIQLAAVDLMPAGAGCAGENADFAESAPEALA